MQPGSILQPAPSSLRAPPCAVVARLDHLVQQSLIHSTLKLVVSLWLACLSVTSHAETSLDAFLQKNCIACHGPQEQNGEIRFDKASQDLSTNRELLEKVFGVLRAGEMPPRDAEQPESREVDEVLRILRDQLAAMRAPTVLKRLTRFEYTNTINDLFGASFNLDDLLPPDHAETGFDKFGESHLMSPHQVMAYLKTARFVAERILPDNRPVQTTWEFDVRHFHGSGRGDFRNEDAHVLSTFYPWRSNLHFSIKPDSYDRFVIPEFGRYRFVLNAQMIRSENDEILGINLGDPRYPTNFQKIGRVPLPAGANQVFVELTLKAGDEVSFTFDSARTWTTGAKPQKYEGPQVRFTRAEITGPIIDAWPTSAHKMILPEPNMSAEEIVDQITQLLLGQPLEPAEREGFVDIVASKQASGAPDAAVARTALIALLTSPQFIYKSESNNLSDVELAFRLSYFLWNSAPDEQLLAAAKSGLLRKSPAKEVDRLLRDDKADRFVDDFTRQWLGLDKVDDLGPDKRVYKKVTTLQVAAMAREGTEFFRHILDNDLSVRLFIDSNFILANDRLAKFYGLPKIEGDHFRSIPLPTGSERGGLIGQAGFLKLTSTAFSTSPIRRGAWILKNLYNQQIDPPADLVIEEPDIRGSQTIREAIQKHQASPSCSRCHAKIDPLGFALEYYDPIGRERKEYQLVEVKSKETVEISKQPIDAVMRLPDGRELRDMRSLKQVLLEDQEQIIKGITGKLISYALGRETTVADDAMINDVFEASASSDHSLRATIQAIVAHAEFQRK